MSFDSLIFAYCEKVVRRLGTKLADRKSRGVSKGGNVFFDRCRGRWVFFYHAAMGALHPWLTRLRGKSDGDCKTKRRKRFSGKVGQTGKKVCWRRFLNRRLALFF